MPSETTPGEKPRDSAKGMIKIDPDVSENGHAVALELRIHKGAWKTCPEDFYKGESYFHLPVGETESPEEEVICHTASQWHSQEQSTSLFISRLVPSCHELSSQPCHSCLYDLW